MATVGAARESRRLTGEMLKKQHYTTLVLVAGLVVVLLNLPGPTAGRLKLAISGLFVPLFGMAASTREAAAKAGDSLVPRRELLREIAELQASNQVLSLQLQQSAEVWRDNAQLNRLLHNPPANKAWKYQMARVIFREPTTWWRSVWIDLGARNGVRTNFAVMTADGLVGKVQNVGETRSQVILLGDPSLRVSVTAGTNNEMGVVMLTASSPRENNMVDLGYLPGANHIRPDDLVKTSGQGGIFPAGILVGKVVDPPSSENGLSMGTRVKLAADVGNLEDVWVVAQ